MAVTVFVCRKCSGSRRLMEAVEDWPDAQLCPVRCQKICSRSVVGVATGDTIEWFQRVDAKPARRALRAYVRASAADPGPPVPKRLGRLVVAKRRGRLRGSVPDAR